MTATASITWFARHELTLAWRDWAQMAAGGRTKRERVVLIGAVIIIAMLHWLAYIVLLKVLPGADLTSKPALITLTASILLTFSMMLSQAIEQVTRAFYARADLDLILSSPARSQHLFAVRIASNAITGAAITALMAAPIINAAAWIGGARWLSAYLVIAGMSALATAIAVVVTVGLFNVVGPKRTRLIAQIMAAVVGAALLIGLQVVAVLAYGSLSRFSVLNSEAISRAAPAAGSMFWMPAHALFGDAGAAFMIVAFGLTCLALAIAVCASQFSSHAVAAAVGDNVSSAQRADRPFRSRPMVAALRHKELTLLARDPWLLSQSLMQILYLLPPALLLWRDMGQDTQVHVILAPVLVMAFGQLAGGLSWLAISGEDAPDLIATAPLINIAVVRAKIEAVLTVIAVIAAPMLLALSITSITGALATAAGIAAAVASAITIQMWFKSTAKRSQFRKRQTATKLATFSEAFSSIFWAGAAGFAAAGSWFAFAFVAFAALTLWLTWLIRPAA